MSDVQPERIRTLNTKSMPGSAEYVLYWSQMNRRVGNNHGLAYAIELANSLRLPVLYYEGLDCSYPYANDRIHTFVLEGVPDTAADLRPLGIGYAFYLRRNRRQRNDTFYQVAGCAAAVVTDDYPTFVALKHNSSVPDKINIPYFVVDSSCVVPMNRFEKREWAAYTIRPKIHKVLASYLTGMKTPRPKLSWRSPVPDWHVDVDLAAIPKLVASCEIDHMVKPSTLFHGGAHAARHRLRHFVKHGLHRYAREKNEPAAHATSNLSPYLHFGHISPLEVALTVTEFARKQKLVAEEFLEELIVRRELAFNFARFTPNYSSLDSLPDWARRTLAKHANDRRDPELKCDVLETASTYDALWNATQEELLLRGTIHGYYRMYWGKKILEWASSHQKALDIMIYLHDKYALDGRDPNTYTNVLWCFGLHDRPWGERAIFGQVRYMSFEGMRRKTDADAYIQEIARLKESGKENPAKR